MTQSSEFFVDLVWSAYTFCLNFVLAFHSLRSFCPWASVAHPFDFLESSILSCSQLQLCVICSGPHRDRACYKVLDELGTELDWPKETPHFRFVLGAWSITYSFDSIGRRFQSIHSQYVTREYKHGDTDLIRIIVQCTILVFAYNPVMVCIMLFVIFKIVRSETVLNGLPHYVVKFFCGHIYTEKWDACICTNHWERQML